MPIVTAPPETPAGRLPSLDQFRGYTVFGMVVVNFLGGFVHVLPVLQHHHTYCSYADTIMPHFLFAVGFGMRLSFLNRLRRSGLLATYSHFLWRCLGLILLGVVVYRLTGEYKSWGELRAVSPVDFLIHTIKRQPFEALTHIGVTSLWVLPVLNTAGWVRVAFAAFSGAAHVLLSRMGYYEWNMTQPVGIDGGPLGFLTWTIPLVAGTLAHDWVMRGERPGPRLVAAGLVLMGAGIALSMAFHPQATWPFEQPAERPEPGYWLMSQRAGSVTYLLFGAGFSFWVYLAALELADRRGLGLSFFALLGRHALAAYLIHAVVSGTVRPFVPKDSPAWWVVVGLSVYLLITTVFIRYLDRNRLYLKL